MKKVRVASMFLAIPMCIGATAAYAQSAPPNRKPTMNASVADTGKIDEEGGPLFQRMKKVLAAADQGAAAFKKFFTAKADLDLNYFVDHQLRHAPFTTGTVQAVKKSCLGPFSIDEGATWVQLAWICRTDESAPIARMVKFRESSELGLTAWFENGRIKQIIANEPLPVPMKRFVPMDAYEKMKAAREAQPPTGGN